MKNHNTTFTFKNKNGGRIVLTLEDIMLMLIVFEHVIPIIELGEQNFICNVLEDDLNIRNLNIPTNPDIRDLCIEYTRASLEGYYTFEGWLRSLGPWRHLAQQSRVLWLKQTVARFTEILKEYNYPF